MSEVKPETWPQARKWIEEGYEAVVGFVGTEEDLCEDVWIDVCLMDEDTTVVRVSWPSDPKLCDFLKPCNLFVNDGVAKMLVIETKTNTILDCFWT